jgi:Zn-dependent protease with chaperone function
MQEPDDTALAPWEPRERENFFDAVNRYQRATWRVKAACAAASLVVFMVFPLLLVPFVCSAAVLLFDLLNLFVSAPDLAPKMRPLLYLAFEMLSGVVRFLDPQGGGLGTAGSFFGLHGDAAKTAQKLSISQGLPLLALAMLPGIAILSLAVLAVNRALKISPLFDASVEIGRPPHTSHLAEQRMRNTIEEMAIAASLPPPRICMIDGGKNAAVVGQDRRHCTVLIGSALLEGMNREQIQALAAQLVSSIANGDIAIGRQTTLALGFFALVSRSSTGFLSLQTSTKTLKLISAVLFATKANATYILTELANPIADEPADAASSVNSPPHQNKFIAFIKGLYGLAVFPLVLGGLVVGLLSSVGLSAGIAYLWRQRKYMLDATAVRLTRNPDGLVSALEATSHHLSSLQQAAWASHMQIIHPGLSTDGGIVKNDGIAFPSTQARQKALVSMGAKNIGLQTYKLGSKEIALISLAGVLLLFAAFLLCIAVLGMMGMALVGATAVSWTPVYILHLILR